LLATGLLLVAVGGIAIGFVAWFAPRRTRAIRRKRDALQVTTAWTSEAGDEFAGLSESARCDLVFAVAALDDDRSQRLLEHALRDPAEAVSIAAARALATSGRRAVVDDFLADNPGVRADRIVQTLALLD
jgi:hypothetical protein